MQQVLPIAVAAAYALGLFAIASWTARAKNAWLASRMRGPGYALAIAVYCTSWTYYGAVGSAVASGWSYVPIYLGPILVFLFGHRFVVAMIDAVKADGANTLSDFIGGRFGKSRGVAALVTVLALLGSIPYIALQIRSLGVSFTIVSGGGSMPLVMTIASVLLALFAMIYGTRHYDAASRSDAVLLAVGFESLFKLAALVVVALLAVSVFAGVAPGARAAATAALAANFAPSLLGTDFVVITLLSMAAILCLPRQFYVTAIQAESGRAFMRARWPFIAYMLVTSLVALPIAAAGLALLPPGTPPDRFVLALPLATAAEWITLLVFLGGFSAATAMVIVETIALATMVSNDFVAPLLVRNPHLAVEGAIGRALLMARRLVIVVIMGAALIWALATPAGAQLASIGLISFAAMAQVAPALILAVTGANRDATAAKAGLSAGLIVWCYTLAFPQILGASMHELLGGSALDPHALLGISGMSPIVHGTLWSLGANLAAFAIVTARRVQPSALPAVLRKTGPDDSTHVSVAQLQALAARFVGNEVASEAFGAWPPTARVQRETMRRAERLIAGVVGLPSARALVRSALFGANLTHGEVARLLDDTGQSLRFSKGLLAATLEHIDPGVSVVDRDLNLVAWNSRYLELFDYPPGMVHVGTPVADLIRYNAARGECGEGEVDAHVAKRLGHMRRGMKHSFERIRPDGRVIKTVGGPMPSGGYVMCFTDVTSEARALAALERSRAELEARVDERTSALRGANQALASADLEKTRFLAAASHDLLQPLHAARLFSAGLARELTPAQRTMLDRVDASIAAADALLRTLLDISKLDAGGRVVEREPTRLRPLLAELAATMAPLAREKGLRLSVGPGDARVWTDTGLLRSIVQNLLSNAIRYTQNGGVIIGVRIRGGEARIDVIDSGPGIAPEQQRRIFREFERLPDAPEGGLGLGLSIVERVARLLSARVSLVSEPRRGSRFSVSLPLASARSEALAAE